METPTENGLGVEEATLHAPPECKTSKERMTSMGFKLAMETAVENVSQAGNDKVPL
jgi:hypothetical protein